MKKNISDKVGAVRLIVALALCLSAGALAVFSFAFAPRAELSGRATLASLQSIMADRGGQHPVWQRLMRSVLQELPAPGAGKRAFAMKAAGGTRTTPVRNRPLTPLVSPAVAATLSPPLRDLPAANQFSAWVQRPEERPVPNRLREQPPLPDEADHVVQSAAAAAMPAVGVSFEGMNISQACGTCLPPDTVGAAGPNHFVQMVNSSIAVYSKTGTTVVAPKAINTMWAATPNSLCYTHNNGDPIVLYDQLADRWLVSQFTVQDTTENFAQCIAISQTADPTGAYYLYEFDESADTFQDYPHIGVWPDGYYMSTNQFPNDATASVAAGAWVFERLKMLAGQTARFVYFDETPLVTNTYTPFGQLPSSVDGRTPPPAGAPNYFVETDDVNQPNTPPATGLHDEIRIWNFHVDWTNPANSTFGVGSTAPAPKAGFPGQYAGAAGQPNTIVPVADFLLSQCQIENGPNDCVPQKQTSGQPPQYLDVLGDRLMFRLTYRNFGDHEALVLNQSVDVLDPPLNVARTSVRWYELRGLGTTPIVYQQGTFAPFDPASLDGPLWRWMGSAAMDHSGNLAIGYSASGPNYFPAVHYAGRLVSDPLNELTQGEAVMFPGQGIEANTGLFPFRNRWGDYSALTLDPTDDCTFWYTTEYMVSGPTDILPVDWHTRIGKFRFPQCVSASSVQLLSVVSRKQHGAAGPFDLPLPLTGTPGIECRTGGANGDHQLVASFAAPVTFTAVTTSCGSVTGTSTAGNEVTVNLTGVPNAARCTVTFTGVTQGANTGDVGVPVNFLAGDTNADAFVNSADISQTKSESGHTVTNSNFREDLNVDGFLNSADISLVKGQSGTALP